jgi:hypothetical protein
MPNEKFANEIFLPCRFMLRRNRNHEIVRRDVKPRSDQRVQSLPALAAFSTMAGEFRKAREVAQPL